VGRIGTVGAVATVLLATAVASCVWTRDAPTDWRLAGPVEGNRLELLVVQPGTAACRPFADIDVDESEDAVQIIARVETSSEDDCPATSDTRLVVVELDEPLGDRELTGCEPRNSAAGPDVEDPGPNCGA
jgi:hypothetical protein